MWVLPTVKLVVLLSHWYCSFCLFHWWWAFTHLICFLLFLVQAPCHPGASPSRSSSSQWWPVTIMNLANDDPNTTMTPTPQQQPPLEQGQPPYYCLLFLLFIVFLWLHPLATATFCLYRYFYRFFVACFCLFVFLILQLVVLLASGCTWWYLWYSLIVVFTLFLFFSCIGLLAICCWPWKIEINIFQTVAQKLSGNSGNLIQCLCSFIEIKII